MEAEEHAYSWRPEPFEESGERAARTRRGPLVVHVEDDDEVRFLCAEILSDAGFEVLGCPTVLAGQVAIGDRVPDLLLLDCDLPDGTGLDLARWVRSNPSYASVPIVVFSGRTSREDVESAFVAGCDAFVGKPCPPAMLVETIEAMVPARAGADPRRTGRMKKCARAR